MLDAYPRLFEPPPIDGVPNPTFLARAAYLQLGRDAALDAAARNVADGTTTIEFPDADTIAPTQIRVEIRRQVTSPEGRRPPHRRAGRRRGRAVPASLTFGPGAAGGEYGGPFATRQGYQMRPDVARAFDRMEAAARADGIQLVIVSACRSDAEQAVLLAQHPDPKWVAPPGTSLHRNGTELDLGPSPRTRGWPRTGRASTSCSATPGSPGTRVHPQRRQHAGVDRRRRADRPCGGPPGRARVRPAAVRGPARRCRPALERLGDPAVGAALRGEQLQPDRRSARPARRGSPSSCPAPRRAWASSTRSTPRGDRRPGAPDARPAAPVRLSPTRARRLQRGPDAGRAVHVRPALRRDPAYVARILGLMSGAGDASGGGLAVRLVK